MLPKGGRKGQRRPHSLLCSLEEKEKRQEDEKSCIGRGELGCMLPWREASSLGLSYLMVQSSDLSLPPPGVSTSIWWDVSPMEVRTNHLPMCTCPSSVAL
jgi:hypothetical protein